MQPLVKAMIGKEEAIIIAPMDHLMPDTGKPDCSAVGKVQHMANTSLLDRMITVTKRDQRSQT